MKQSSTVRTTPPLLQPISGTIELLETPRADHTRVVRLSTSGKMDRPSSLSHTYAPTADFIFRADLEASSWSPIFDPCPSRLQLSALHLLTCAPAARPGRTEVTGHWTSWLTRSPSRTRHHARQLLHTHDRRHSQVAQAQLCRPTGAAVMDGPICNSLAADIHDPGRRTYLLASQPTIRTIRY